MNHPSVSIICPLFNKYSYIRETIDSVINQTYLCWEMIIVDDGSTDGSYELTDNYIAGKDKIKLYRRSDFSDIKGGSVCRNIGLNIATGEFIIFLDADDLLLTHCLERRILLAESNFSNQLFIFHHAFFYNDPEHHFQQYIHHQIHKIGFYLSINKELFFLKRFLKYDLPWTISNVLWKKQTLCDIDGFDEEFQRFQDPEVHTKALLLKGVKIKCFKYSSSPDVLIRLDRGRHGGIDVSDRFIIYIDSIVKYTTKFHSALISLGKKHLINKLNGYFFSAEANINYFISSPYKDSSFFYNKRNDIKIIRKNIGLHTNMLYEMCIRLHAYTASKKMARRLKIPAFIYKCYMMLS